MVASCKPGGNSRRTNDTATPTMAEAPKGPGAVPPTAAPSDVPRNPATNTGSTPPAQAPNEAVEAWEDLRFESDHGAPGPLGKRWPVNRVPVLARPGMIVFPIDGSGDGNAVIADITPDFCIVRYEDGKTDAFRWGEVHMEHVLPDPAALGQPSPAVTPPATPATASAVGPCAAELLELFIPIEEPNGYLIHEDGPEGLGRPIANVQPNRQIFDAEACNRIATLMAAAPDLWRQLRKLAGWLEGSDTCKEMGEAQKDLHEAVTLLWQSAGRYPFKLCEVDEDEEKLLRKQNSGKVREGVPAAKDGAQ